MALPALLLSHFLLILGLTLLVAAIVPFVPDLRFLVEHLHADRFLYVWDFLFRATIPERYQPCFYLNPMANIIEAYRDILLHRTWPNWSALAIVAVLGFGISLLAYEFLTRNDHLYPKLVQR
ncbi:MAG: hypothetical protein R3F36_07950 [Candidatus Competibacteraceae bacterium]